MDTKDLDETRRLLYGCLVASQTKRWELVGTVANALLHHSEADHDREMLLERLVDVVERGEDLEWAYLEIDRINGLLDDVARDAVDQLDDPEPEQI